MSFDESGEAPSFEGFWSQPAPGKLIGRGHVVGDFLEADQWDVLENREGCLRLGVGLPPAVMNLRGQLFGGFTPTYVDFIAIHTWWAGREPRPGRPWLSTLSLRVEYFAAIVGPRVLIEGRVLRRNGSTAFVEVRFLEDPKASRASSLPEALTDSLPPGAPDGESALLAYATVTLKAL